MKVQYIEDEKMKREEMIISYHPKNREFIKNIQRMTEHMLGEVYVYDEYRNQYPLPILKIYYIEIIDHKVIVYTKDEDYRMYGTLQAIKEKLKSFGFFQINMRTLVNKLHILRYEIKEEGRRHIHMDNDEILVVNRHYKNELNKVMIGELKCKNMKGNL